MMTFNIILDYIITPLREDGKIYIPSGGKKMKFLLYLKRLGRVTRVCNPLDDIQTSYRLYTKDSSKLLTYDEISTILNLIPLKEEDIVETYFKLVEMGYSINIFEDILISYFKTKTNKLEVLETLNIEGLDKKIIKDLI